MRVHPLEKQLGYSKDLDLTGKIKQITCANADAIGYIFREDGKILKGPNYFKPNIKDILDK